MSDNKFSFQDLNSFVDGRFQQLYDDEKTFFNQAIALMEMHEHSSTVKKYDKEKKRTVTILESMQEQVDNSLDRACELMNKWENMVYNLDEKYSCQLDIAVDDDRFTLYNTAEVLLVQLTNLKEIIDVIDTETSNFNKKPNFILAEVYKSYIEIFEKLFVNLEKMENRLAFNRHILQKLASLHSQEKTFWS